jgi:predicted transcriptional regulator
MSIDDLIELTACVVSSFVSHNATGPAELPGLIKATYAALAELKSSDQTLSPPSPLTPAVPIDKSVTRDYIICLDDGRKLKTLKRYIRRKYSLSPEEYRAHWGLPEDYPMVAPSYAELRSSLARRKARQAPAGAAAKTIKNGPIRF